MKRIGILFAGLLLSTWLAWAQTPNHGITFSVTDTSAATCLPANSCIGTFLVFEGPASGQEVMVAPFATFSASPWLDDGPSMNAYLGTTRCYLFEYQEVIGGTMTLTSGNSTETCFSFPNNPAAPSATGSEH